MILVLIGMVALIASVGMKNSVNAARIAGTVRFGGLVAIAIGLLLSCVVQIGSGEVGVQQLFGRVQDKTLSSGLTLVNPLVDVIEMDIRTQNYTMSAVHTEGDKEGDDAIRALSADGLELIIDLTVLYRLNAADAPRLIRELGTGYRDVIVRPVSRTKIRDNAVYYDAVALYGSKRAEFQQRIYKDIEAEFKKRGLILEGLLIRNIALPESVKKSIESKINAEQDAQKMTFVLQKEKQEAERKRVEAQGIADYQHILNTQLTDKLLQYEQIKAQKELALSANAKVIVMGGKGNTPIIIGGDK